MTRRRKGPPSHRAPPARMGPGAAEENQLWAVYDSREWDRLEAAARAMVARYPDHSVGWRALGLALQAKGSLPEAADALARAIRIAPGDTGAHGILGAVLHSLGLLAEAEACYRRLLAIRPRHAGTYNNLGNLLRHQNRLAEAEACYRRALAFDLGSAQTHNNLGSLLKALGRLGEAQACYRRALALQPDFLTAHSNLLLGLLYEGDSLGLYGDQCREYGRIVAAQVKERFSTWHCSNPPGRLRVGLVSGDLRRHPVGYFIEGMLTHIDPTRVELRAYPTVPKEDELSERLRPLFAAWKPLVGLSDEAAARLIHDDSVHVLLDLSGHTAHNRLPVFAWKPAPVQASWLGYFASTGVAEIDWLVADETGVPAEHRAHYLEKIWYLPETRLCFTPPETEEPVAPPPALQRGFVCFGSFQEMPKINDDVLRVWARILAAWPGARLRLQNDSLSDPEAVASLRARMQAHGVAPERVDFHGPMPRGEYLAAHAQVDLLLDTFPFPGGTTTCEALWMGVPTLTLSGTSLIARQGESLLKAARLSDWIATDEDQYVAKAVAYASDLRGLATLRAGLRAQVATSPLFDARRFARHFEDALWGMWRAGLKAEGG